MQCQNCEAPVLPSEARCQRCGAKLLHRRVVMGGRDREFALTAEDETVDSTTETPDTGDWQFPLEERIEPLQPAEEKKETLADRIQWGGFVRRIWAFGVDFVILLLLFTIMVSLSYIGYKVGLAAYDRTLSVENSAALYVLLAWGGIGLTAGYFVLFHGMEGKTIGKWLLGLKVVGANQGAITYKQAFFRWLAMVCLAPIGLGFLWILWSREKRGWHDFLARTWVIRG